MKKFWLGLIVVIVIVILAGIASYNGFVSSKEAISGQFAQIETQYQRRVDLIPNLVASVKGVMNQEKTIFTELANARTSYMNAKTSNEKIVSAGQFDGVMTKFLAIAENYPELKSSENVQTLMTQLEGTENRISVERKTFNDLVVKYNLKVKTFPSSLIAKMFGFTSETYFASQAGSDVAPKVSF